MALAHRILELERYLTIFCDKIFHVNSLGYQWNKYHFPCQITHFYSSWYWGLSPGHHRYLAGSLCLPNYFLVILEIFKLSEKCKSIFSLDLLVVKFNCVSFFLFSHSHTFSPNYSKGTVDIINFIWKYFSLFLIKVKTFPYVTRMLYLCPYICVNVYYLKCSLFSSVSCCLIPFIAFIKMSIYLVFPIDEVEHRYIQRTFKKCHTHITQFIYPLVRIYL